MPRGGFKRSRALWDATRQPQPTLIDTIKVWFQAISYELQPIRIQQSTTKNTSLSKQKVQEILIRLGTILKRGICSTPSILKSLFQFSISRSSKEYLIVLAILAYYFMIRWIHEKLDAGPMVLIITCLIAIFTIGLGDDSDQEGRLSAYSVFNRGFERLLGSVDVDSLLAQHVGGGGAFVAAAGRAGNDEDDGFENQNNNNQIRRRQQQQQQRQQRMQEQANAQNDNDNGGNAAVAGGGGNDNNNNNNNNRSRKSGKKARRRNLEERRELRQQREAAIALGMHGDETEAEMMAMQRLIEEQLAQEQQQQQNNNDQ